MNLIACEGPPLPKKSNSPHPTKRFAMKLFTLFATFLLILVHYKAGAQQISMSVKNASLSHVLEDIKKQSGYSLLIKDHLLENTKPVTISIKNGSLKTVLDKCLQDQNLTYEIISKTIVVHVRSEAEKNPGQIKSSSGSLKGTVTDTVGTPLPGVTIKIQNTSIVTTTDEYGRYFLLQVPHSSKLLFSMIGYRSQELNYQNEEVINIQLHFESQALDGVSIVSTGYQKLPKERATGSFEQVGKELFNRNISMNFTDHIKNLNAGIFYNNNANYSEPIIVRSRSTIYSSTAPLIVLDNFPYDGDIQNINPSDIESVTILKDAAAASIWGARAGNGVIVINTKKGRSSKPTFTFDNTITVKNRPSVTGMPVINSADYIELEKVLFSNGYYINEENSDKGGFGHPPFTPVVELLRAARDGKISTSQANTAIEQLKQYNAKKDIQQYLYRTGKIQQHNFGVSGNTEKINYYLSTSWDRNLDNLVGRSLDRISIHSQQSFQLTKKMQLEGGINYTINNTLQGNNRGYLISNGSNKALYPYARLVDDNGNAANLVENYNQDFIAKAKAAGLQDWSFNPVNDIAYTADDRKVIDLLANTSFRYSLQNGLSFDLKYQYENQQTKANVNYSSASFFARNLINQFTQVATDGTKSYPIPLGAIVDLNNAELASHQGRVQANYNKRFGEVHEVAAIAGWEIKNIRVTGNNKRYYGFDPNSSSVNTVIDYKTRFQQYDFIANGYNVPNYDAISGTLNRYLSYYANASYIYKGRYILSGSAREDASNLFGVNTNQKGVPLWSAGGAWIINKEDFFKPGLIEQLKLRATYGYQGNIYNKATAYATATYDVSGNTGLPIGTLKTPPNEKLRWEKNATLNIGLDFELKGHIFSGSIEYYNKKSKDLMGYAPVDPTSGVAVVVGTSNFFGNVASMQSNGIDLSLHSALPVGAIRWNTTFLLSYVSSKITGYVMPTSALGSSYLSFGSVNPVLGKPVYALYSYKWAGLDPANGNPRGYLNGLVSSDYGSILAQTKLEDMVYKGPSEPTTYGAWRNTFTYKSLSLSFNISYKLNYYYRKPSINYSTLFQTWSGSSDYAFRWQKPGDEIRTNVPSLIYPADDSRDRFYNFSEVLIEKADHIRLEDITASYNISKRQWKGSPFENIRLYSYISNLGLLWRANKSGIDPDYVGFPNPGKSYAIGLSLTF